MPSLRGLRRLVPILTWLPAYERRWLRFDAIAGATIWGLLVQAKRARLDPGRARRLRRRRAPCRLRADTRLLAVRLEAPLFYANTTPVRDRIKALVGASDPPPTTVILHLGANGQLDITSAEMLDELVRVLRSAGGDLVLAEVHALVLETADRTGLLETLGDDHVFHTVDDAVRALSGLPPR